MSDRNNSRIYRDDMFRTEYSLWSSSAAAIRFAELHIYDFNSCKPTVFISDEFCRVFKKPEFYTFFLCVHYFFGTCRKLFFAASVYDIYIFCSKSFCTSCCIHSNISSAEHSYIFTDVNRGIIFREFISLHKIYSCQKFICRINSV